VSRLSVVVFKVVVSVLVLTSGFTAVSDDDFARVVLMQDFAHDPALDPTGTSWLPVPFWLNGSLMMLLGTSLAAARALAFAWGLLAAVILYQAADLLFERRAATYGAMLACALPWSARLGVATVPELITAALVTYSVATLTTTSTRDRALGAAALLVATLSRYEPWFVAAAFSLWCAIDARRHRRRAFALAGIAALVGPIGWLAHNAAVHGDALHFVTRVSAYKKALGSDGGWLVALTGYPLGLLREEPELCLAVAALVIGAKLLGKPWPAGLSRVAVVCGVLLGGLTAAALPGGAPTHHAGRALLCIWLCSALYVGAAAAQLHDLSRSWRLYAGLAVAFVVTLGAAVLRPWYARLDSWADRGGATSIGLAAAKVEGQVLVEVRDYGFYAVQAGSGEPWRFTPERSIDPRGDIPVSAFADVDRLAERAAPFAAVVAQRTDITEAALGQPHATAGSWGLWRAAP
jgi:Dolichyl-phosphate-mannose-protein mannosyltransferase